LGSGWWRHWARPLWRRRRSPWRRRVIHSPSPPVLAKFSITFIVTTDVNATIIVIIVIIVIIGVIIGVIITTGFINTFFFGVFNFDDFNVTIYIIIGGGVCVWISWRVLWRFRRKGRRRFSRRFRMRGRRRGSRWVNRVSVCILLP
jgi:hypothetical protein